MKNTNTELMNNMKSHVGKKVKLVGDHPHAGKYGITDRVEIPGAVKKPGMVIKLDDGGECFVFDPSHLFFILAQVKL